MNPYDDPPPPDSTTLIVLGLIALATLALLMTIAFLARPMIEG